LGIGTDADPEGGTIGEMDNDPLPLMQLKMAFFNPIFNGTDGLTFDHFELFKLELWHRFANNLWKQVRHCILPPQTDFRRSRKHFL